MPPKRPARKTTKVKRPTKSAGQKLDLYAKHKNEYVANAKKPGLVRVGPIGEFFEGYRPPREHDSV